MRDGSPNAETTDGTNKIFSWPTAILEYVSTETSVHPSVYISSEHWNFAYL